MIKGSFQEKFRINYYHYYYAFRDLLDVVDKITQRAATGDQEAQQNCYGKSKFFIFFKITTFRSLPSSFAFKLMFWV